MRLPLERKKQPRRSGATSRSRLVDRRSPAFLFRLPLPRQPLRLGDLRRRHLRGDGAAVADGSVAPLFTLQAGAETKEDA